MCQQHAQIDWEGRKQDSLALVALYQATDGEKWIDNNGWLQDELEYWSGILTNIEGRVICIDLFENNLKGELPPEIGQLESLITFYVHYNKISSIPREIKNIESLQSLYLSKNPIKDFVLSDVFKLVNLTHLGLENCCIKDSLNPSIGNLKQLTVLNLCNNMLFGEIPSELGQLKKLTSLDLGYNSLTGPIPKELGNLKNLYYLRLNNNFLAGEIPVEFGQLENLQFLNLDNNQISGTLPKELDLPSLIYIYINNNLIENLPDFQQSNLKIQLKFNHLSYDDIIPNLNVLENDGCYFPQKQKSIDTIRVFKTIGDSINLNNIVNVEQIDTHQNNVYVWYLADTIMQTNYDTKLIIDSLNINNSGYYQCKIFNTIIKNLNIFSDVIQLTVSVVTEVKIYEKNNESTFCSGDTCLLYTNFPDQKHIWYKDGLPVENEQENLLKVYNTGAYSCRLYKDKDAENVPVNNYEVTFSAPLFKQQITGADNFCFDDSVMLFTSKGFYDYNWYHNGELMESKNSYLISSDLEGDYQVEVLDNTFCISELSDVKKIIKSHYLHPPSIEMNDSNYCDNGYVTLVSDNTGIIWSDGKKNAERKIYQNTSLAARVFQNGCFSNYSDTITIDFFPGKPCIYSDIEPNICIGDSIRLYTVPDKKLYKWFFYDENTVKKTVNTTKPYLDTSSDKSIKVLYVNNQSCKSELSDAYQINIFSCWNDSLGHILPDLRSGTSISDYQIFSFPYVKEDADPISVFGDELGQYNISKWRLFHYSKGTNEEYLSDFSKIERGVGYWLLYKPDVMIHSGKIKLFNYKNIPNGLEHFTIDLLEGWNQIGNPYQIDIPWQAILNENKNLKSELITYNKGFVQTDTLKAFSGGFVWADSVGNIFIPYKPTQVPGSIHLKSRAKSKMNNSNSWKVILKLECSGITNNLGAFGMNSMAKLQLDNFDLISLPDFPFKLKIEFQNDSNHINKLCRDMVPCLEQYFWDFSIESDLIADIEVSVVIEGHENIPDSKQLILYNYQSDKSYDLKSEKKFRFSSSKQLFRAIYGDDEFSKVTLNSQKLVLYDVIPNPVKTQAEFSFFVAPNFEKSIISLNIYDVTGRYIQSIANRTFTAGFHTIIWTLHTKNSTSLSSGIYYYSLHSGNEFFTKKLILTK